MLITQDSFVSIGIDSDEDRLLIEHVFGDTFFVTDDAGQCLTTLRNQRLLRYAREILARAEGLRPARHEDELARLGQLADTVTPEDYRRARDIEGAAAWRCSEFEHAESAGSLE